MTVLASIAVGSNIGRPADNVLAAFVHLAGLGQVVALSSLYLTKPWGVVEQADFCNAVAQINTDLSARALLAGLKSIEATMGRTETYRWGPRLIDLDILTFGNLHIDEPGLTIPHPRMLERTFVLVPLAEIDKRFAADLNRLLATLPADEALPRRLD